MALLNIVVNANDQDFTRQKKEWTYEYTVFYKEAYIYGVHMYMYIICIYIYTNAYVFCVIILYEVIARAIWPCTQILIVMAI